MYGNPGPESGNGMPRDLARTCEGRGGARSYSDMALYLVHAYGAQLLRSKCELSMFRNEEARDLFLVLWLTSHSWGVVPCPLNFDRCLRGCATC